MKSPFKFLDSYERKDREIFFGREKETAALYELVNQNRLVLLYGSSGTGKTSLIQCGLGNRFPATDWYPLFVRRGNDLNASLRKSLEEALGEEIEGSLSEAIEDLYAEYLRPVYLIFDQFEEIFVLGDEAEQAAFIQDIAALNAAKLPCQIIFSLREEYLAHLYPFEQVIPTLLDRRLRVEPMNFLKAAEVIQASCSAFNIELEEPEANARQIIDKVSAGRSGISLPYLQVYLDRLYLDDIQRTYGANIPEEPLPALEFTAEEIDSMGNIGDVLKIFLQEQRERIQQELLQKYPDSPDQAVRKILNGFASLEGTKIPLDREEIRLAGLSDAGLSYVLGELEQSRILREEDGTYELAHDTLSLRISEQRSAADIALLEAADLVQSRMRSYERTHAYLNIKELQLIENYTVQLKEEEKLSPEAWNFVKESQQHVRREENRRKRITGGVIAVLLAFLAFAGWQWFSANQNKNAAVFMQGKALVSKNLADSLLVLSEKDRNAAVESQEKALAEKTKADSLLIISRKALEDMKIAQKGIVDRDMDKKDIAIYNLRYELAYDIIQETIDLKILSTRLRKGILELAFYYNEIGRLGRADSLLTNISGYKRIRVLTRSASNQRENIRDEIQRLIGKGIYNSWKDRYYPAMIRIDGGKFWMGNSTWVEGRIRHEVPQNGFRISKFEVTAFQYELYLKSNSIAIESAATRPSWGWKGDYPMVNVNWYDAALYCNWMSRRNNLQKVYDFDGNSYGEVYNKSNGYRLPSEQEWEFAAGGGNLGRDREGLQKHKYSGSDILDSVAWYPRNTKSPQKVGQKKPNELGLYDMSGNVSEWCHDMDNSRVLEQKVFFDDAPGIEETSKRRPPIGDYELVTELKCGLRGGAWDVFQDKECEVSYSTKRDANKKAPDTGFRILLGFF